MNFLTGLSLSGALTFKNTGSGSISQEASAAGSNGRPVSIASGNSGSGTNLPGGSLVLQSGAGTGSSYSQIVLYTPTPSASGTAVTPLAQRLSVDYNGLSVDSGFAYSSNTSSSVSTQTKTVPTLTNSWTNYDSTETTFPWARYYRDAMGIVHLEGLVKNTAANANAIFTLPAGYRPKKARLFAGNGSSGYVDLRVDPTGAVGVANGVFGWVSLDGVTFLAEQ